AGKCSQWRTEPSKGVVLPMSEVSVAVIGNLDDPRKIIPVWAVGTGTTVATDQLFTPELKLEPCF
ncbi:hypothetical protein Nmel_012423, partial [Mimus melanotis]